jgi:hypothetical protein
MITKKYTALCLLVFYFSTTVSQLRMRGFHKPSPFVNDIERSVPKLVEFGKKTVNTILSSSHTIINPCYNAVKNVVETVDDKWYKFRLGWYISNNRCLTDFHGTIIQCKNTIQINKALFEKCMLWYQLLPKGETLASCPHVNVYIDIANSSPESKSTLDSFRKKHSIPSLYKAIRTDIFDNDWASCLVRHLQYTEPYVDQKTREQTIKNIAINSLSKRRHKILGTLLQHYKHLNPCIHWIHDPNGIPISLSLPLSSQVVMETPLQITALDNNLPIACVLIKHRAMLVTPGSYCDCKTNSLVQLYTELLLLLQKDFLVSQLLEKKASSTENYRFCEPICIDLLKLLLEKAKQQFTSRGQYMRYIFAKDIDGNDAFVCAIKSYEISKPEKLETIEILAQTVSEALGEQQASWGWEFYAKMLKNKPMLAPLAKRYTPSAPSVFPTTVTSV